MPFPAKKHRQYRLATGISLLGLLLLGGCVSPSARQTALSPEALTAPSLPHATSPAVDGILPSITPLPEAAATTPPLPAEEQQRAAADFATEPPPVATATPTAAAESFASYYAKRFNGRRTCTGERYDPEKMTAATRDFPLQSWIKVINPANGKEVNVRINDRTGKRKTPLVDLSRAAARKLGFLGKGKIRVQVIPLLPTP